MWSMSPRTLVRRCTILVAAIAFAAWGAVALAQEQNPPPRGDFSARMFDRLDPNKTGFITWDAYWANAKETFDRLDTNHDGVIDQGELAALANRRYPERQGSDSNGAPRQRRTPLADVPRDTNGNITLDAYQKWTRAQFDAMDTAHDGKVTRDEFTAYTQAHRPQGQEPRRAREPVPAVTSSPAPQ